MIPSRVYNTKEHGTVEFLVYREGNGFVGVCLTFDIVEEGTDPVALMKSIKEAALLHIETVVKKNLDDDLLNRYAPQEYWDKYLETTQNLGKPDILTENALLVSPYSIASIVQFA